MKKFYYEMDIKSKTQDILIELNKANNNLQALYEVVALKNISDKVNKHGNAGTLFDDGFHDIQQLQQENQKLKILAKEYEDLLIETDIVIKEIIKEVAFLKTKK